jgi:glycerophosphoryl diester phosphodiesterase
MSMLLCMLAAIVTSKPSAQAIIAESWKSTQVVGHRGAAAYQPENTLPGFEDAIKSGAAATECDIHLSRDGEMVVIHDKTLDRTTSLKGEVGKTAWPAMKEAGIPCLADLTKLTKNRIVLVVEIKGGEGIERKMIDHLVAQDMQDQAIVFSFGKQHVAKTKDIDARFFGVWLVAVPAGPKETLDQAQAIKADGIGFSYKTVTPALIQEAQRRKMPVFVWTVPPGPEVDRLKAMRVNFIITDHPRDVLKQLRGL